MNVAGYGQSLREIANANLQDLAAIESERQKKMWAMDTLQARAKGEAIGSLVGTVAGAAKGGLDAYNQSQATQDAQRGAEGRKEYGVLTDNTKPVDSRVRDTYGQGAVDAVNSRVSDVPADTKAAVDRMKDKAAAKGVQDLRREMTDLTKYEPRVSTTDPLLGSGKEVKLVSNNPWRDYAAVDVHFDPFVTNPLIGN